MIISKKHKYVFASVPKTGTHTMYKILTDQYHGERYGGFHHAKLPPQYNGYFKFCTVRNPYSKFASIWYFLNYGALHNKQITEMMGRKLELVPLLEFMIRERNNLAPFVLSGLRLGSSMTPSYLYINRHFNFKLDKIIKIEELESELHTLPFINDTPNIAREFSQSANPRYKKWEELKTPVITELVNIWAKEDFEEFNYEREEP